MKRITIEDARRGFRRTARRTPDRLRSVLVFLAWTMTAGLPALGLSVAGASVTAAAAAGMTGVALDHYAIAVLWVMAFALTILLLSPLLKAAWNKIYGWEYEIRLTKGMED